MQLVIEVPGPVVPKQRPRVKRGTGNVIAFTPKRTRDYENVVKTAATESLMRWRSSHNRQWPTNGRFAVSCFFYMPDHRIRDLDNCFKSVTDGINKLVFEDDSQIDEFHAFRDLDKANPRTVLVVRKL